MIRGDVLVREFKDIIFPLFCLGCEAEGFLVCPSCFSNISLTGVFCCPGCHQASFQGKRCENCLTLSWVDEMVALAPYEEDGLIGQLIQVFKYHYVDEARGILHDLIRSFILSRSQIISTIDAIIAVPLHRRRQAERGFNQAAVLAEFVAAELNIPLQPILVRRTRTEQQAKLNKAERKKNVYSAFSLLPVSGVQGKSFLLVDDVFTTGSTMQECARVLKEAGASRVIGFTIARG